MIILQDIFQTLSENDISWSADADLSKVYNGVLLLSGREVAFLPKMLYLGFASKLPADTSIIGNTDFLLINDTGKAVASNNVVGVLPSTTDVYSLLAYIMGADSDPANSQTKLFQACADGKSVRDIIEIGYEILQSPLLLSDVAGNIRNYYPNADIDDPVWRGSISGSYQQIYIKNPYNIQELDKYVMASKKPVIIEPLAPGYKRRICGKLITRKKITGYITVIENDHPFTQADIEKTHYLCQALSIVLLRETTYAGLRGDVDESLLLALLSGMIENEKALSERMVTTKWRPYNNFFLLVVPLVNRDNIFSFSDFFRDSVKAIQPNARSVIFDSFIVFLLDFRRGREYTEWEPNIIRLLEHERIHAGLSVYFDNLMDIKKHFNQAKKAYEHGRFLKDDSTIYKYNNYYFIDLIESLDKKYPMNYFYCPEATALFEYDRVNGTTFADTFYQYLLLGQNMASTAKKLFIHRNTMAYRLEKIQEITGIDVKSGEDCYRVFISFKIKEIMDALHK